MKIAVIGAGIFGSTAAIKLAEAGYKVDLIEKEADILQAASGINQYRLHRGYHYPRSIETAKSAKLADPIFRAEYQAAIIDSQEHYYAIAKVGSKINAKQFTDFCDQCDLEYEPVELALVDRGELEAVFKVKEALFDPAKLRELCHEKIKQVKVNLRLNTAADHKIFGQYDLVVNCTYANLNSLLRPGQGLEKSYQFELCEKPVLKLPADFARVSLVVIDGPFMCIDQYDQTGFHVMGNVVHAIHSTNVGPFPNIPEIYKSLLNRGVVPASEIANISKIKSFIDSAKQFIPTITEAEHIGSLFTFRTVLPNLDKTDARPTLVEMVDDKMINVFSGKVGNSILAAEQILGLVSNKSRK